MTIYANMTAVERAQMAKRLPKTFLRLKTEHDSTVGPEQERKRREALERWKPVEKPPKPHRIMLNDIKMAYLPFATVPWLDIISPLRSKSIVRERHVLMWIARNYTSRSFPEIGRWLGGRDHASVMHAVRKIEANQHEYTRLIKPIVKALEG